MEQMKFILETKSVVKTILYCLFCLMPSLSHGKEISVPSSIKTIHEAVSIAQAGDTIVVDSGEYIENILIDKTLTLKSKYGP
jgi:nitrous oxidase accessory protein NosD